MLALRVLLLLGMMAVSQATITSNCTSVSSQLNMCQSELKSTKASYTAKASEASNLWQENQSQLAQIKQLTQLLKDSNLQVERLKSQLQAKTQTCSVLEKSSASNSARLAQVERDLTKANTALQTCENSYGGLKAKYSEAMTNLKGCTGELRVVKGQLSKTTKKLDSLTERFRAAQNDVSVQQSENERLQARINRFESALTNCTEKVSQRDLALEQLKEKLDNKVCPPCAGTAGAAQSKLAIVKGSVVSVAANNGTNAAPPTAPLKGGITKT